MKKTSASRYSGDRKPTNIVMSEDIAVAAKAYFATTRDGSMSGFVERKIREELRKCAPKLRAAGIHLPAAVLTK